MLPGKLHQPLHYCGLTSVSCTEIMPQTQSRTMMTERFCLSLYVMCVELGHYFVFTMSKRNSMTLICKRSITMFAVVPT